ncbi:50S ribosomal protein L2 [Candidatus Micrarchaeota archaeon]|nr:50S ribosomal protein L2 [Candidatus Micrarchaeota archaeon]
MGKRLKQQRRGSGSPTYRFPSTIGRVNLTYRNYDDVEKTGVLRAKVLELVDDAGRDSLLMRVKYDNNEEGYLLAPEGIMVGSYVEVGAQAKLTLGSVLPLYRIPDGAYIYNIERNPGDGGKLVKAPGSYANIVAKEGEFVYIKLPSRETMIISNECRAQLGVISGGGRLEKPLMKAGNQSYKKLARHRYWPTNRGVHQSAYTHPHGGKQHHVGKSTVVARSTPPGGKVGHIAARSTGRKKSKKATEAGGES